MPPNFKRQTVKYLQQLPEPGSPIIMTVKGKAKVVVHDPAAYQRLVERAAQADHDEAVAAIRAGLADADADQVKPALKTLKALAKKYGLIIENE